MRHVSRGMSCDHKTCLVIARHVLRSQDMPRDRKKCVVITIRVLRITYAKTVHTFKENGELQKRTAGERPPQAALY